MGRIISINVFYVYFENILLPLLVLLLNLINLRNFILTHYTFVGQNLILPANL